MVPDIESQLKEYYADCSSISYSYRREILHLGAQQKGDFWNNAKKTQKIHNCCIWIFVHL